MQNSPLPPGNAPSSFCKGFSQAWTSDEEEQITAPTSLAGPPPDIGPEIEPSEIEDISNTGRQAPLVDYEYVPPKPRRTAVRIRKNPYVVDEEASSQSSANSSYDPSFINDDNTSGHFSMEHLTRTNTPDTWGETSTVANMSQITQISRQLASSSVSSNTTR